MNGRNLPETMLKSNYDVGDSGILLGNHLFATQGRTPSHLNIYHIQDDNFVKDAKAKYFEFEIYLFQTGFETPRNLQANSTSKYQPTANGSKYLIFKKPHQKETLKSSSNLRDPEFSTNLKTAVDTSMTSPHRDDSRQLPIPIPTSTSAFLLNDKPIGPKIIESKIHGQANSVASDHSTIQATDGHTHTEFMVKSYQAHGYYKNADVQNVVISNGITAME